jgi:hypothetical protein
MGPSQTINTAKPLKLVSAYYRITSSSIDVPISLITRDEYDRLSNKFVTGTPSQIYFDPQRAYSDVFMYPVPDSTFASANTVFVTYQRTLEDFDATGDEPDFPQEWFDALTYLLADRLAPEYGLNMEVRNDIMRRAMQYKQEALSFGTEGGSFYFQAARSYR